MASIITPFDPTTATSGQFNIGLVSGGWLFIHNLSPAVLKMSVSVNQGAFLVPAYSARCFHMPIASDLVKWTQLALVLSQTVNAPVSSVFAEAYDPSEWLGGEGFWPLSYQLNQPRMVSVPMPGPQWYHGKCVLGNNVNDVVDSGQTRILLSAANITNNKANLYIYDFVAEPQSVGWCYASFQAQFVDSGLNPLGGTFDLFKCTFSRAGVFGPTDAYRMTQPAPTAYEAGTLPANSFAIKFYWTLLDGYGGMQITTRMHAGLDLTNGTGAADFGNWPIHTGTGVIF